MKRTWLIAGAMSAGLILMAAPAAMAGEWRQDAVGYWWQNDDGTYPVNRWQWLDGNQDQVAECYYFNENGYLLTNTITPDLYTVNADGAWVLDGVVQTQSPSGTPAAAEGMAQNPSMDIDRTMGGGLIKPVFIECIGRDRSQVEALLGVTGEPQETEDYAIGEFDFHIDYVLNEDEDVRIDYKDNIAVRIFGTNVELLNFEKDEYSLSEIDAIFGVTHVTLMGNAHFWNLQDNPKVTVEMFEGFVSINAY